MQSILKFYVVNSVFVLCTIITMLQKDSFSLLSICIISQQVFQILYFLVRDPLDCSLKYWILLLGGHQISHM